MQPTRLQRRLYHRQFVQRAFGAVTILVLMISAMIVLVPPSTASSGIIAVDQQAAIVAPSETPQASFPLTTLRIIPAVIVAADTFATTSDQTKQINAREASQPAERPHVIAFTDTTASATAVVAEHAPAPPVDVCSEWLREITGDNRRWDPKIVLMLIKRESNCEPSAVSRTGDWGLLQLNAACWAGTEYGELEEVQALPPDVRAVPDLLCAGAHGRPIEAQWCYRAKEEYLRTGDLPESPCDAWLEPAKNLEVAYTLWLVEGWSPWCFNEVSRKTQACRMVS